MVLLIVHMNSKDLPVLITQRSPTFHVTSSATTVLHGCRLSVIYWMLTA